MKAIFARRLLGLLVIALALVACNEGPLTISVDFETLGQLKAKAPVYAEKGPIGYVEKVQSTDNNLYRVELAIEPFHKALMNSNTKFYIQQDPLDPTRDAVVIAAGAEGGVALKKGSIVQGEKRPTFFGQLMDELRHNSEETSQQMQKAMDELRTTLQQRSQDLTASMRRSLEEAEQRLLDYSRTLKSPIGEEDLQKMQQSLDGFIAHFKSLNKDLQAKLREEVLPQLQQSLEELRQRLLQQGRKDEAEKVEKQIDQVLTI